MNTQLRQIQNWPELARQANRSAIEPLCAFGMPVIIFLALDIFATYLICF